MKAIFESMERDSSILLMGEGSRVKYSLDYPQILRRFPDRVMTTPVCEGGIVNAALGAALTGTRPLVDLTFDDLALRAMDEILNHVSKLHFATGGNLKVPLVIKADFNRPENAQSGNRYEAFFSRFPGLKVFVPSTPTQAYLLMRKALSGGGPVVFFEDRVISHTEEIDAGQRSAPVWKARAVRRGRDITIVCYGYALYLVLEALREIPHVEAELIDMQCLNPLDIETISSSVRKTGRLLIVELDQTRLGIGAEISAQIGDTEFDSLRAPIKRIGMANILIPAAPGLQRLLLPTPSKIAKAVESLCRLNAKAPRVVLR